MATISILLIAIPASACLEIAQRLKPFGDTYFSEHSFEFFSGGLRVDGDLFYFNSEKGVWTVVAKNGEIKEFDPDKSLEITLTDDKTGQTTGTVTLGKPKIDGTTEKKIALATFSPNPSPGAKSKPPKLYLESMTFDLEKNPTWGLGRQKLSISNNAGLVLSTVEVEHMEVTRSIGKREKQTSDNVLDLSKKGGHYKGNGCGALAPVGLSDEEKLRIFQTPPTERYRH